MQLHGRQRLRPRARFGGRAITMRGLLGTLPNWHGVKSITSPRDLPARRRGLGLQRYPVARDAGSQHDDGIRVQPLAAPIHRAL
jgi:hypothetical protein